MGCTAASLVTRKSTHIDSVLCRDLSVHVGHAWESGAKAFDGVCDHQGFTNLSVMRSDSPMACIFACSAAGPDRSGGRRCTLMSSGSLGLALISETPATRKPVLSATAIR